MPIGRGEKTAEKVIRYNVIQDYWWQYCTSHTAVYVLGVIVAARGGCYAWGQERLAKESHCTPRTVRRVTAQLEQAGLISIIDNDKRFNRTSYTATALALSWDKMSSDTEDKMSYESGQNVLRQADKMSSDTEDKMSSPNNNVANTEITNTNTNTGANTRPESPDGGQEIDLYGMALEAWCETYKQNLKQPYNSKWSVTNDLKDLTAKVRSAIINKNRESGMNEQSALPTDEEIAETLRGFLLAAYRQGDKFVKEHWDVGYINRHFEELFVLTQSNSQIYNDCKLTEEELADLRNAGIIQ